MEKGFEKIILQFTTDFENTLLKKQGVFILQNCDRQNVFTINVWAGF